MHSEWDILKELKLLRATSGHRLTSGKFKQSHDGEFDTIIFTMLHIHVVVPE